MRISLNMSFRLISLAILVQPVLLLGLDCASQAHSASESAAQKAKEAQAAAKIKERAAQENHNSTGNGSLPDYLTSPKVLLPSTYYTKRNAYKNPTWYLCALSGHGSGTLADPFRLDDLPVGGHYYFSQNSKLWATMKGGDTLVLEPGTYNMDLGSGQNHLLVVPAGTAQKYTVVTAANPANPPVINGAQGDCAVIGGDVVYGGYTIYENLIVNENESNPAFYLMGNHIVVRNCDIQGDHKSFAGDNRPCLFMAQADRCQLYDNHIWGNDALCIINGQILYGYYTPAILVYNSAFLDVFHNNFEANGGGGTVNKDSGGASKGNFFLPVPYTDVNCYRANLYHDQYAEYLGTLQGPDDTLYVRDNVFAGTTVNSAWPNTLAAHFHITYRTIFENNLILMPQAVWIGRPNKESNDSRIFNNIIWSPQSVITAYYDYNSFSKNELGYMDHNIYIGPGTSEITIHYGFGSKTYDMFGIRQAGAYELHSGVYSDPSQVFLDPSTFTLLPRFRTAASDGGAPGPRLPLSYITNTSWYGVNAPLVPSTWGLTISNGKY